MRRLLLWGGFPYVFQVLTLAAFVALAAVSWGVPTPAGVGTRLFAKAHLVTLVVWGLWWPAMVWTAVLLGRAWCMVCPLELVTNGAERVSRRLALPRRSLPKWIASGWVIVGLYALIQMLVAGVQLHRVPARTSLFLSGLLALAAVTGLLLKDRAFCRGFCPVGLLLSTYGRGGMLAVRAGDAATCRTCTDKGCVRAGNRTRLDARSCPSLLNPARLDSNRDCLVCGQCVKACAPDNMRLLLRRPFAAADAREPLASWPVTLFVTIASGFVLGELFTEWPAADEAFLAVPARAAAALGVSAAGWLEGLWALALVPLAWWSLLGAIARRAGPARPLTTTWRRMALPLAVLVAAGHMGKGLAKIVSWAPFLPGAWKDPSGLAAAAAITTRAAPAPAPLLGLPVVGGVGLALIALALHFAIRELRLAHTFEDLRVREIVPLVATAAAYSAVVAGWIVG